MLNHKEFIARPIDVDRGNRLLSDLLFKLFYMSIRVLSWIYTHVSDCICQNGFLLLRRKIGPTDTARGSFLHFLKSLLCWLVLWRLPPFLVGTLRPYFLDLHPSHFNGAFKEAPNITAKFIDRFGAAFDMTHLEVLIKGGGETHLDSNEPVRVLDGTWEHMRYHVIIDFPAIANKADAALIFPDVKFLERST